MQRGTAEQHHLFTLFTLDHSRRNVSEVTRTKGAVMRTALFIQAALATAAIGVLALPAIPAGAADSAITTIGQLEAQGFHVKLDRVGSAPLSECVVTNVRNTRERTEIIRVTGPGRDRVVPVVVDRTITVSLDCANG
jgi:hypothetical protein